MNGVLILILNYNSSNDTIKLFEEISSYNWRATKVLVIDNHSIYGDQKSLMHKIPIKNLILNNKNLGYAGGNNLGIEIALNESKDYVWILNPDIRVEKETLPTLLRLIKSQSKIAAVGPRIRSRVDKNQIFSDGGVVLFDKRCHTDLINYGRDIKNQPPSINFNIDYVDGSCILINMEAIKDLGVLPIEYFLYFEETDWCTNAKRNGWILGIDSFANAYNLKSDRNKNYIYFMNRNRLLFAKKYHPSYWNVCFYYLKLICKKVYLTLRNRKKSPLLKWEVKGVLNGIKLLL